MERVDGDVVIVETWPITDVVEGRLRAHRTMIRRTSGLLRAARLPQKP
jgi:hypothetical protein